MRGQRRVHAIGVGFPPTGRTLDIGEQKRHDTRRCSRRSSRHSRRMPHGPHPHLGTSWECGVKQLWSEATTSKLVRMQTRPLGRTGLDVAPVALGTASIGEMFGPATVDDAVNVVHRAIERGVNVIDTSVHYGSAEERLGVALAGRRDRVILATKAG